MLNVNGKNNNKNGVTIANVVEQLCSPQSYLKLFHQNNQSAPMPSIEALSEAVELLRAVLFPGYFGSSEVKPTTMPYYVGATLDKVSVILSEQIMRGFCFGCAANKESACDECDAKAIDTTHKFLESLPKIRALLASDVMAAYTGDPAATSPAETIFCYPSVKALSNYRIAHELYKLEVPLIPRIITELAHSETGIDIHPGADIGEQFFMDHGTGIVIGETTIIGKNVRIYQGVTLGAKSFPMDENGNPIKGIPRHPIVEDDVIVYSGATILGRVTIGKGAVIGGNIWLTHDVPAHTRVLQGVLEETHFESGGGI